MLNNHQTTNEILNINNNTKQKKHVVFIDNFGKSDVIEIESYKRYNKQAYGDVLQELTADKDNKKFYRNEKYIKKIIKRQPKPNKWQQKWDKMSFKSKIGWSIITLGIRPLLNLDFCCSEASVEVME